ncbi:MAG: pyridoxine 5'-phosphate synthase, partial [Aestuariivirgaceae bacterium]
IRQSTSDHGWNIAAHREFLNDIIGRFKAAGLRVSIFVDPDPSSADRAKTVGADRIEIYTGPYGGAFKEPVRKKEFDNVVATGMTAKKAGIGLNAGHDLTLDNLPPLVEALPHLEEVSIGHCIISDALTFGMADAVRRYRQACGDPVST